MRVTFSVWENFVLLMDDVSIRAFQSHVFHLLVRAFIHVKFLTSLIFAKKTHDERVTRMQSLFASVLKQVIMPAQLKVDLKKALK